jgi:hypothetical protein
LQAGANQKRSDDFHQANLQGNNLTELPSGKHVMQGVQFEVGDGVLLLGSTVAGHLPKSIQIQVGRKFDYLHVLHAAAYAVDEAEVEIGRYTLCYEDATTHIIPIVNRKDLYAFWKRPGDEFRGTSKIGWEGTNDCVKPRGLKIQLYASSWENPRPDRAVVRIDFTSTMTKVAPFCVAITTANVLQPKAQKKLLAPAELDRLWTQLTGEGTPVCEAIETLAGAPTQTVPFIASQLVAADKKDDQKKIADLIVKLDDDDSRKREQATSELRRFGVDARSQLRRVLEESKSPEVRLRAESLLEEISGLASSPNQKRLEAALYVLELIPTEEARMLIGELAAGKAGPLLAAEAGVVLKKLKQKR